MLVNTLRRFYIRAISFVDDILDKWPGDAEWALEQELEQWKKVLRRLVR